MGASGSTVAMSPAKPTSLPSCTGDEDDQAAEGDDCKSAGDTRALDDEEDDEDEDEDAAAEAMSLALRTALPRCLARAMMMRCRSKGSAAPPPLLFLLLLLRVLSSPPPQLKPYYE